MSHHGLWWATMAFGNLTAKDSWTDTLVFPAIFDCSIGMATAQSLGHCFCCMALGTKYCSMEWAHWRLSPCIWHGIGPCSVWTTIGPKWFASQIPGNAWWQVQLSIGHCLLRKWWHHHLKFGHLWPKWQQSNFVLEGKVGSKKVPRRLGPVGWQALVSTCGKHWEIDLAAVKCKFQFKALAEGGASHNWWFLSIWLPKLKCFCVSFQLWSSLEEWKIWTMHLVGADANAISWSWFLLAKQPKMMHWLFPQHSTRIALWWLSIAHHHGIGLWLLTWPKKHSLLPHTGLEAGWWCTCNASLWGKCLNILLLCKWIFWHSWIFPFSSSQTIGENSWHTNLWGFANIGSIFQRRHSNQSLLWPSW